MRISPFFRQLRAAYQAELDDLTSDSEGKDVLRQRLTQKRKEMGFLLQMIEFSPEMVAVVFHQAFRFKSSAAMDNLITHESEDFPEWHTLADSVQMAPWALELSQIVLKEPKGEWFMTVAAGLEYMHSKPDPAVAAQIAREAKAEDEDDTEVDADDGDENFNEFDADEEQDARAREEAGADWMVEQGFDRKD
jgi:hypothetical protein